MIKVSPLLVILLLVSFSIVSPQPRYAINGTYKRKSAQGMAIYDDFALLFNDGGACRKFSLLTGEILNIFKLACSSEHPHVNNACFGIEKSGISQYPVIYISECRSKGYRCFVESIGETPKLVQTIQARKNGEIRKILNWVVDCKENALYAITRVHKNEESERVTYNSITKYRLPKLNEGPFVTLTEKDVKDSFVVVFPNVLQGCKIRNGLLYQCTGFQQSRYYKRSSKRAIIIIDLKKKRIVNEVDLTNVTEDEPEDIDFYKDKCLLFCGQQGGIYEIDLK